MWMLNELTTFAFTASHRVQIYNIYIYYIDAYTSVMYPGMTLDEINNSWVTFLIKGENIIILEDHNYE